MISTIKTALFRKRSLWFNTKFGSGKISIHFLPIGNSFLSCNCSTSNIQYVSYIKDCVLASLRSLDRYKSCFLAQKHLILMDVVQNLLVVEDFVRTENGYSTFMWGEKMKWLLHDQLITSYKETSNFIELKLQCTKILVNCFTYKCMTSVLFCKISITASTNFRECRARTKTDNCDTTLSNHFISKL